MNSIKSFTQKPFMEKLNSFKYRYYLIKSQLVYKFLFRELGKGTYIGKPLKISNHKNISIKHNVSIWPNARVEAITKYNDKEFSPLIFIDEWVSIQQNLHLTCANRVVIGKNTAIAANVTITDIHHPYEDINLPIEKQDIIYKEVIIESDCKIYNNVVILPGVHIGKHCTIGANSVVTRDIPDYSVAVGNPSKIVKRYNFNANKWQNTNQRGEFLNE